MLNTGTSGKEIDICAMGVCLYVLMTDEKPFNGRYKEDIFEKINKGSFLMPDHLSKNCQDLIKKMLSYKSSSRITASEILKHPWIVQSKSKDKNTD